nr:transposase [Sulfitobacter algicola]
MMAVNVASIQAFKQTCIGLQRTSGGIGGTFRAAVDDPARFFSSRTVAAHFGLTPRRYQSGEMDNPGRISKVGDRDV